MNKTRTVAIGVLLGWMCRSALAVPPLDRPSPPPCCADGRCYASPATFGVYETRWRRWPLECVEQAPTGKPTPLAAPLQRDVSPFETPPAEQEDRKAPEPTVPRTEETSATPAPGNVPRGPGGATLPPTTPPSAAPGMQPRTLLTNPSPGLPTPPQTSPLSPPGGQGIQPSVSPSYRPTLPPTSPLNRSGPTGDLDPPPSLPFGPQSVTPNEPVREASQPATMPNPGPIANPAQTPSNDPPPAPPVSLASWEN